MHMIDDDSANKISLRNLARLAEELREAVDGGELYRTIHDQPI